MDCNETSRLLEAYVDDELDLVRHLEIEEHLRGCATCAQQSETLRSRREALREQLPRFVAPAGLAEAIRDAITKEAPITPAVFAPMRSGTTMRIWWQLGGLAAGFACVLAAGFAWGSAHANANRLFDEAVAEHVRSLQVDHLTDVTSTDRHTVKPWFAGKLDFSPPVVDLASAGFPLEGGRLDHLDRHTAAALVFHRRQHAINLFIWPATASDIPTRTAQQNGFNVETWSENGFNFVAVSEIPRNELGQFKTTYRSAVK